MMSMAGGGRGRGRGKNGREGFLPLGTQHLYSGTVFITMTTYPDRNHLRTYFGSWLERMPIQSITVENGGHSL